MRIYEHDVETLMRFYVEGLRAKVVKI